MAKRFLKTAILFLVLALLVPGCVGASSAKLPAAGQKAKPIKTAPKPPAGKPAKSFRLPVAGENRVVSVPGDFKGKKILMIYYSST